MMLKLTQFAQTPATRSMVCPRCGYQMFWTKRFNWQCGPGCDGAYVMLGRSCKNRAVEYVADLL